MHVSKVITTGWISANGKYLLLFWWNQIGKIYLRSWKLILACSATLLSLLKSVPKPVLQTWKYSPGTQALTRRPLLTVEKEGCLLYHWALRMSPGALRRQESKEQLLSFPSSAPLSPASAGQSKKGKKKTYTLPLPQPFSECTLIYLPGNLCFSCLFSLNSHSFLTPLFSNSQMLSHVFAVISYPFFLLTRTHWHILLTTPNFPSLFFPYDKEVCQTLENTYC